MMTAPVSGALSDSVYWDDVYRNGRRPYTYPDITGNRFHFILAGILKRYAHPGSAVMELGCGGSLWLPFLAREHGCRVFGMDFSREGIRKAQEQLDRNGVKGELYQADFTNPPRDLLRQFDFVYSLGVVEHFDDPGTLLRAFVGYLKPDGKLLTWIPNTAGFIMRLQRWADRDIYDRHRPLWLHDLIHAHVGSGLTVLESGYARFLDLSMVNVYRWPLPSYRRWMTLAKIVNGPFRWLEQTLGLAIGSKRFSASSYVVAEQGR